MKIIVTGGAGFIGSHVSEYLSGHGHDILILDNLSSGRRENLRAGIQFAKCDLVSSYSPMIEFKNFGADVVVHLAAQPAISLAWENPLKDAFNNIVATLNVIQAAQKNGVKKIIFSSSSAVYDETTRKALTESTLLKPASPYGISKMTAENYLQILFPESTILRFGNVYGPRQIPLGENQVIARMIRHFEKGDEFYIHGDGKQKRDFVFVADVVEAIEAALTKDCGIYNVASGESTSVNEVARLLAEIYEVPEYAWEHTRKQDARRKICMDISAAGKNLGWTPKVGLREGLQKTIDWWKSA